MTTREHVCYFIDKWLKDNDVSVYAFAKAIGVVPASAFRWVKGVCAPDLDLFPKICEYMNISVKQLLGFSEYDNLTPEQTNLIDRYMNDESFRNLVDKYRDDEEFRVGINGVVKLMK